MAEPKTAFTASTIDFIATNASLAEQYGNNYGVSPRAVMGAIANEYDTRFNPDLMFDGRGYYGQAIGDLFGVSWRPWDNDHEYYSQRYELYKSREVTNKYQNPAAVDVGPGNVKIATAIETVRTYTREYRNTGADPLGLLEYSDNCAKLVNDLFSFDSPRASFGIATAYLKGAEAFFAAKDRVAWNKLTSRERDALLVSYYKLGRERLSENIDTRIAIAKKAGADFNFDPSGDGSAQHLENAKALEDVIKGKGTPASAFPHPISKPNPNLTNTLNRADRESGVLSSGGGNSTTSQSSTTKTGSSSSLTGGRGNPGDRAGGGYGNGNAGNAGSSRGTGGSSSSRGGNPGDRAGGGYGNGNSGNSGNSRGKSGGGYNSNGNKGNNGRMGRVPILLDLDGNGIQSGRTRCNRPSASEAAQMSSGRATIPRPASAAASRGSDSSA